MTAHLMTSPAVHEGDAGTGGSGFGPLRSRRRTHEMPCTPCDYTDNGWCSCACHRIETREVTR